jgi:hypothetical protein
MNKEHLKKSIGTRVRLRPAAVGPSMGGLDEEWTITEVGDTAVRLVHVGTDATVVMGLDAVVSFTSDPARDADGIKRGFLQLTVQVEGRKDGTTGIEPLALPRGGANPDVASMRLGLRKDVAAAHIELEQVMDLIRKCHQSRIAVMAARGVVRSGMAEKWKQQTAVDLKEVGTLKRELPNETQDFSMMPASELETLLVNVHRTQKRGTAFREQYEQEFSQDEQHRREIRAWAEERGRRGGTP